MTPAQTQDTRTRLLEAGIQAFLENGFHGTGIKAVLDAVGVPKGSFYNYFASKDAFGAAAIEHYASQIGQRLGATLDGNDDPLAGLRAFFREEMTDFERSDFVGGCLVANLGGELEGSPTCRAALSEALGRYIGRITQAFAEAQELGLARRDLSAEQLSRFFVDAWEGAVIRMKIERSLAPLEQCLELGLDGFVRAGGA